MICLICQETVSNPQALKCIHTYCLGCIQKWVILCGTEPKCPLCKHSIDRDMCCALLCRPSVSLPVRNPRIPGTQTRLRCKGRNKKRKNAPCQYKARYGHLYCGYHKNQEWRREYRSGRHLPRHVANRLQERLDLYSRRQTQ